MKLYCAPQFSSLADHIAMLEAGMQFDIVKIDIGTKEMEGGGSYFDINPMGQVPALVFDDGEVLTENAAILTWVAGQAPKLAPQGALARYRLIEMLSCIASELHKRFPIYLSLPEEAQKPIAQDIQRWLDFLAGRLERGYLFGEAFSVADAYLFVMARGAAELGFTMTEPLPDYLKRVSARPTVQEAIRREGAA
jgi:glutathione S-transferase